MRPGLAARVARRPNSVGREVQRPAGDLGAHPRDVEGDVGGADRVGGRGRSGFGAAEDRAHAGDQLARRERLGQVVVGAEFEAEQLVELVVARGEHDDRRRRVAADLAGDVEAVGAGQAQVEDDEVRVLAPVRLEGGRAVGRGQDRVAGVLEVVARELHDRGFVIDDEDGLHRGHRSGWSSAAAARLVADAPPDEGPRAQGGEGSRRSGRGRGRRWGGVLPVGRVGGAVAGRARCGVGLVVPLVNVPRKRSRPPQPPWPFGPATCRRDPSRRAHRDPSRGGVGRRR